MLKYFNFLCNKFKGKCECLSNENTTGNIRANDPLQTGKELLAYYHSTNDETDWTHSVFSQNQYKENRKVFTHYLRQFIKGENKYASFCLIFLDKAKTDNEHIHFVHACRRHHGSCRCFFKQYIRDRIGRPQFTKVFSPGDKEGQYNLLKYFGQKQQRMYHIFIRGRSKTILYRFTNIRCETNSKIGKEPLVQSSEKASTSLSGLGESDRESEDDRTSSTIYCRKPKLPGEFRSIRSPNYKKRFSFQEIILFIQNHITCPINKAKVLKDWRSEVSLCTLSDKIYLNAIEHVQIMLTTYTLPELYSYIQLASNVYFEAFHIPFNDYYYSITQTLNIVKDLLEYQFGGNWDAVHEFICILFHVLNRSNGKKNTIEIIGDPNSFKSTFVRMIASAMINSGWCNKNNKLCQFGLQECANKRLIIMDDPNFDIGSIEQLKTIFSGDPTNIQVKHKDDFTIYKTPVILCANTEMFRGDVWDVRMERYRWKRWNTVLNKQLHPLALYHLFQEYNLL